MLAPKVANRIIIDGPNTNLGVELSVILGGAWTDINPIFWG